MGIGRLKVFNQIPELVVLSQSLSKEENILHRAICNILLDRKLKELYAYRINCNVAYIIIYFNYQ